MRPTLKQVRKSFAYRDLSCGLQWRGGQRDGKRAGSVKPSGYRQVSMTVRGKEVKIYEHVLVWFYHKGRWPTKHLDHINRDPQDNSIENLREVTRSVNTFNSKIPSNNKSGIKGVAKTPNGKWIARIGKDGRTYRLGTYDDIHEAAGARVVAEAVLYPGI